MRWPLLAALTLTGCASCPQPATPVSAQGNALALVGYSLAGRLASAVMAGTVPSATAVRLNAELQTAQADLRAGKVAEARTLIDSVKKELP